MIDIVMGEFTILILWRYGFKVCVILFGFYSTRFKVYFHLLCINTLQRTTAPFNNTPVISSRDQQTIGLYQGSADCCEGYGNSGLFSLLHPYLTIHYCNQSLLAIFPDLNIFIWSITNFGIILRSALVQYFSITW